MDSLFIENIKIEATIGMQDWERQIRQTLYFDLAFGIDAARTASTDDITDSKDYAIISRAFQDFVESSEFFLIETLAEKAAAFLLSKFELPWVRLKLTKPGIIRNAKSVSVTIERHSMVVT